jgi:hypothetical protein
MWSYRRLIDYKDNGQLEDIDQLLKKIEKKEEEEEEEENNMNQS